MILRIATGVPQFRILASNLLRQYCIGLKENAMSVLCPKCFERTTVTVTESLVREDMVCSHCNHAWIERSSALKEHKNSRLNRLEEAEEAVMVRRYEKLDQKFNDGVISPQEYSEGLKALERQNRQVQATLRTVWTKRF